MPSTFYIISLVFKPPTIAYAVKARSLRSVHTRSSF